MRVVPVFQTLSRNGPTTQIQKGSSFFKQLTAGAQPGFKTSPSVNDARREGLVKANSKVSISSRLQFTNQLQANGYSDTELMKFARQSGPEVFRNYYMAEGRVDRQNSFLSLPLRKDHIESFRKMAMQCNPSFDSRSQLRCSVNLNAGRISWLLMS
jgi:hypothetical protein